MVKSKAAITQHRVVAHITASEGSIIVSSWGSIVSVWAVPNTDGLPEGISFDAQSAVTIARGILAAVEHRNLVGARG